MELARRAIAATTARVVLDPFIGSGTTAVAALLEGREYVGIDLSDEYCRMARQRIAAVVDETARANREPSDEPVIPSALEVKAMLENRPTPARASDR